MRLSNFAAGMLSTARRRRVHIAIPLLGALAVAASALVLASGALVTSAVQHPSVSLDMVTDGTAYDDTTNTMTVGAIDNCLTSGPNAGTHTHNSHLVVQNVEDLVAYQVRLNYIGDRMRPQSFSP